MRDHYGISLNERLMLIPCDDGIMIVKRESSQTNSNDGKEVGEDKPEQI